MSLFQQNKYPLEPPYEDEVVFFENTTVRQNPQGLQRKAKICPICNYPIHIRIISFPCTHYFCYQCYNKNTYMCGLCGSLNSKIERIDDNATFYSCDSHCHKYFNNQQTLTLHEANHHLLNQQIVHK